MRPKSDCRLQSIYWPLRLSYGVVPIVAGADKYIGVLTNWEKYLPEFFSAALPIDPVSLMQIVGLIEMTAGLAVLTVLPRMGAYVVMLWLILVAMMAGLAGFLDVAVRDLMMAMGAWTLGQLAVLSGSQEAALCDPREVDDSANTEGSNSHVPAV